MKIDKIQGKTDQIGWYAATHKLNIMATPRKGQPSLAISVYFFANFQLIL